MRASVAAAFVLTLVNGVCAADTALDAVTSNGDKVRLFPNGRWEYVDAKKAEEVRPQVQAYEEQKAREQAKGQGGLFGVGRRIQESDKDYNRGSLNPKMR